MRLQKTRDMRDKNRRKKFWTPAISQKELWWMHRRVKGLCREKRMAAGTTAYNLLAALGACKGNWPRVRAEKVAELRALFRWCVPEADGIT